MTHRLLVDVSAAGQVSLSVWRDGELPDQVGEAFALAWPLDDDALEDLRWYLEDYLPAPYAVYEERGSRVEASLPGWGEAVFTAVFGAGAARDAYVRARAQDGALELVFRSASPRWLGMPWELLRDPGRASPVALDGVAVSRSLPAAGLGEAFRVGGERLRVLMVISRPAGPDDVGYRMVARPLLRRLEAVRGEVDLVVLRPPTLERLREVLASARAEGQPFQVVHFDGHGVLAGRRAGGAGAPLTFEDASAQGVLVFEKATGGDDPVPAETVARVLAEAKVPVVVLNACQSGALDKQLEASVATRLLQEGAACVVAMAYSVYAVAAAEFMAAFYERLFAGDRASDAVAAGRQRLAERCERPSPKGPMPLADWVVPVQYARREVHFPQLLTVRPAGPSLGQLLDRLREGEASRPDDPLDPVGEFVGRDALFHTLEVAARLQRVVVLHGPGGTGKTELAKAFGRWWRDTGGVDRPEWVVWHSFEPGLSTFGLDGVVNAVGLEVLGPDFVRGTSAGQRRELVLELLATHRLLLVWDNFESARSMPDPTGATPPLDEEQQAELREFLHEVAAHGSSTVIITSRSPETWLGELRRVAVPGLTPEEAVEYADQVLAPYPAVASRRAGRAFGELMEWLDGSPLSMRLVLPHLETTGPQALLAALRGLAPALPDDGLGGRTGSLQASITYSFNHLSANARRLVPALCLFHGVADADVLGAFSRSPDVPSRFRGRDAEAWTAVLDEAAGVGLLTPLGLGMYRIHPALPGYLADRWRAEDGDAFQERRAAAERGLLDACAALAGWADQQIRTGDAALAFTVIHHQRRTLGAMLGYALDHRHWQQAQVLVEPLSSYWDSRGLFEEARGWADRARLVLEDPNGDPPPLDTPGGALWMFLVGAEAGRAVNAHLLDKAEQICLRIQDMLIVQPDSTGQRHSLGAIYHQLGRVAQRRGRLGEAEEWFRRSLAIKEELGDRPGMAISYHQLGMVAEERGRLGEAEEWFRRSLAIEEELGNRPGSAISYHQLGVVRLLRGRLGEAEEWFRRSLAIREELGDRPRMALSYAQLGLLTERRGHPAQALEWMVRCVALFDEFPHQATGPGPEHLARLTAALGMRVLEDMWLAVTGANLPETVRSTVDKMIRGIEEQGE